MLSLLETDLLCRFAISRKVISPTSLLSLFTTGSFSILLRSSIFSASCIETPSGAVIRYWLVIISVIGRLLSRSKRKSRFVTIPLRIP